jgi:hypothetical protein
MNLFYNIKHRISIISFLISERSNFPILRKWKKDRYSSPSPQYVKWNRFLDCPSAPWIETGTYIGATSKFLSSISNKVTTIEADYKLFMDATSILSTVPNVKVLYGESSLLLASVVQDYIDEGHTVINMYLDAHFSGGFTFKSKTESGSIIVRELESISSLFDQLVACTIFIDDFRLFKDNEELISHEYPAKNYLVNYANKYNLKWSVEHDMFILSKTKQ